MKEIRGLSETVRGAILGSVAAVAMLAGPAGAEEMTEEMKAELKARLEALKERLNQVEQQQDTLGNIQGRERIAPAQAVTGGEFPGSWKLPGSDTSITFSGYVKTDAFYSMNTASTTLTDSFIVSNIAVDNSAVARQGGDFRIHARRSRIRFLSATPTEWGRLQTRIEGDFAGGGGNERFSNSNLLRIRQAYGQMGPVLAGQTQSTFNDADTGPDLLDPGGPAGETDVRQAQIRYTYALAKGLEVDGAIENPEGRNIRTVAGAAVTSTNFQDKLPDFVARLRWKGSWGALNVAGVLREFTYDDGAGAEDSAVGYGGRVGATINTWGKDNFKISFAGGKGLGRYMDTTSPEVAVSCASATTAGTANMVAGCGADLHVMSAYGVWASYTHFWQDNLRSNLLGGWSHSPVDTAKLRQGANGRFESGQTVHANLIWSPVKRVDIGAEFMWGWRQNAAAAPGTEKSGQAGRAQVSFLYNF
jgi:hypothetical protein